MKITEIQTIPIRSLGKPAARGKGRVIVTPLTAFYDDLPGWGARERTHCSPAGADSYRWQGNWLQRMA